MTDSEHRYIQKQVARYLDYSKQANQEACNDCLYRIASCLDLTLEPAYTPAIGQLALDWLAQHHYLM